MDPQLSMGEQVILSGGAAEETVPGGERIDDEVLVLPLILTSRQH